MRGTPSEPLPSRAPSSPAPSAHGGQARKNPQAPDAAGLRSAFRGATRRAGWGLTDQALSSVTNFALSIAVARSVDAAQFGAFGLAFTVYLLSIGFTRAVCAEPLLVRFSTASRDEQRSAATRAAGAATAIGLIGGAICGVAGFVSGGLATQALVPLAAMLPGLLIQDTLRHCFFAEGRPRSATANDAVWAVSQLLVAGGVIVTGHASVSALVLAWGTSATVAAAFGCIQAGIRPRITSALSWSRQQRDLIPSFIGEFAARNGSRQLTMLMLSAVGGLAALGAVRGSQVLFGPLNVLLLSVGLIAVPEVVRVRQSHPEHLPRVVSALSGGLAAAAVLAGAILMFMPPSLGEALLGDSWNDTRPVLLPQAMFMASIGATSGYLAGLRALEAPVHSLSARLVVTPMGIVGGLAGVFLGGAIGAMIGLALSNWAGVIVWRHLFTRAMHSMRCT